MIVLCDPFRLKFTDSQWEVVRNYFVREHGIDQTLYFPDVVRLPDYLSVRLQWFDRTGQQVEVPDEFDEFDWFVGKGTAIDVAHIHFDDDNQELLFRLKYS